VWNFEQSQQRFQLLGPFFFFKPLTVLVGEGDDAGFFFGAMIIKLTICDFLNL
jgi:hypothetical protein